VFGLCIAISRCTRRGDSRWSLWWTMGKGPVRL
jgi:hypothetical protein